MLSKTEREEMTREFLAHLDANPQAPPARPRGILSPYMVRFAHAPAFALFFTLAVATGTTYAAESSLPKDLLYPIKTGIIEPVFITAPAVTREAQARATTDIIERRLDEAHELLERDEMDAETASEISQVVVRHASSVRGFAADASASGEIEEALDTTSDLENALEAHERILDAASDEKEDADEAVRDFIDAVGQEADGAEDATDAAEEVAAANADEDTVDYARDAEAELSLGLKSLREELTALGEEDELSELAEEARELLAAAEASHARASALLANGTIASALPELREGRQSIEQAKILVESLD